MELVSAGAVVGDWRAGAERLSRAFSPLNCRAAGPGPMGRAEGLAVRWAWRGAGKRKRGKPRRGKAPSTDLQAPENHQISIFKLHVVGMGGWWLDNSGAGGMFRGD